MEITLSPDVPTDCFSRLPDETIVEILCKVACLKSLCSCALVSRRFNRIVSNDVDTVSIFFSCRKYKKPFRSLVLKPFKFLLCSNITAGEKDDGYIDPFDGKFFFYAYMSIRFSKLRDLRIQLPACHKRIHNNRSTLFKWKVTFRNSKVDSFVFLFPDSVYDNNGNLLYRGKYDLSKKLGIFHDCFDDMAARISVLLNCIVDFPLLEKVIITHSDKKGTVSLGGQKLTELRMKRYTKLYDMFKTGSSAPVVSRCQVPLLELPVSGYVMKGATLILATMVDDHNDVTIDRIINNDFDDDFDEDKVEAAYSEAMMQILNKHKGSLIRVEPA